MDDTTRKGILIAFAVTVIGGLVVYAIQELRQQQSAVPVLSLKKVGLGKGYVDILSKSESSRSFVIYSVHYRFRGTIKEAPAPPAPPKPSQVRPRPKVFNHRIEARRGPPKATAMVDPDNVVAHPPAIQFDTWLPIDYQPLEVEAYKAELVRLKIINKGQAGGRYWVDACIGYGDEKEPSWLYVAPFEIDVVSQ